MSSQTNAADSSFFRLEGREPLLSDPVAFLQLQQSDKSASVDIDLTRVTFVCPFDLVALAVWSGLVPAHHRGTVLLPESDTASYLERMNLLRLLRANGWRVPDAEEEERELLVHKLLEVTELADVWAVEDLGDKLPQLFAGKTKDQGRSRALHFAFGELCDNAATHSEGTPIYVAAQRYTGATSGGPARLELAVADGGIGIPTHLRRNPGYSQVDADEDAVALALKPGVTGTRDRRGYGFHDVIREASAVGSGDLMIYSAGAAAHVPFGQIGRRRRFRKLQTAVPGTWIQIRVLED